MCLCNPNLRTPYCGGVNCHPPNINSENKGDIGWIDQCPTTQQIVDAVNALEDEIFDTSGGVEYFNMTYKTNSFVDIVEFLNIRLWTSEDDMRNEDEHGRKEPLECYLRRQLKSELRKLRMIEI